MLHIATSCNVEKSINIDTKMSSPNKWNKKRLHLTLNFDIIISRREKNMVDTINTNQYLINTDTKIIFQSYNTIMFTYYKNKNKIVFNTDEENYTKTTCKYLGKALEKINDITKCKYYNLNHLCYYSDNRKKDILLLVGGVLKLC